MGKSSPPPAPDYASAAQATAAGDIEAAKFATKANRINQTTPYGNLTYQYTPEYNDKGEETGGGWSQTETLSPIAQQALDQELALNKKYGEVANIGFDKTREIFENPELDMSSLPKRAIDVGQTAQDAILSRVNPQIKQREDELMARLANQGITLGSEAYNREMTTAGQNANDLILQAALQGISLDQANRSASMQEQAYLQDRPLNLINALRTGNQVTSPEFQQFAQQATTQGADLLGATKSQYNAAVSANNAANAGKANMAKGLFGLATGVGGLGVKGGGTVVGNFFA
jgi:hypothetical protein